MATENKTPINSRVTLAWGASGGFGLASNEVDRKATFGLTGSASLGIRFCMDSSSYCSPNPAKDGLGLNIAVSSFITGITGLNDMQVGAIGGKFSVGNMFGNLSILSGYMQGNGRDNGLVLGLELTFMLGKVQFLSDPGSIERSLFLFGLGVGF